MHADLYWMNGEETPACRILLLGLGGGGCNAVQNMTAGWMDGPLAVGMDTDAQALEQCRLEHKVQLGSVLTQGQGAGGDSSVGTIAAEDDIDTLRELVKDVDLIFLNVALGGGTGTGVAPVIARTAREQGVVVLCFATLPFSFEGEPRQQQARVGLRDLRLQADAVIVQPNDRLLETSSDAEALVESYAAADAMLGVGVRSMWKLLNEAGIMNLNFADVRSLIESSEGTCSFGYGAGVGSNRDEQALDDLVKSPLLDRGAQLAKSASMLVNIAGGSNTSLQKVERVMKQIKALARSDAHILMGVTIDHALQDHFAVTLLVSEKYVLLEEDEHLPLPDVEPVAAHAADSSDEAARVPSRSRSKRETKRRRLQDKMVESGKDRFKGVEPTLYQGQDLDVPTYVRKGVKLAGG